MQRLVSGTLKVDTLFAFAFGVIFLVTALVVTLAFPLSPGTSIETVIQVVLALAAAAIAAGIPGLASNFISILSPGKVLSIRIAGGLAVFFAVFSIHPRPEETVAVIEVCLLFLTPFLVQHILNRFRIQMGRSSLLFLVVLILVGEAAFFSELAGGLLPKLPPGSQEQRGVFAGEDLRGSSTCKSCLQHLWVRNDGDRVVTTQGNSLGQHELTHVLLEVEWNKWERIPLLKRNYEGSIYYTLDYQCNVSHVDYSLKPGRIVLSWLIGFAEIPFLLDDSTVRGKVERIAQENLPKCST